MEQVGPLDLEEANMATAKGTARAMLRQTREAIPDVLRQAKREAAQRFLAQPSPVSASTYAVSTNPAQNGVGVGIGRKITGGKVLGRHCIRIYVERKIAKGLVPEAFMLPKAYQGIETDVIEVGRFRALP